MPKLKDPITELRFPVGGFNRRAGFDQQPPFSTPYALNVRPFDVLETRQRGGARPGLVKSFSQQLGVPGPIQLIDFASVQIGGNTSNVLLAISGGILYSNWANVANMAAVSGGGIFNPSALTLQGCQIGNFYYIVDYIPQTFYSQVGEIKSGGLTLKDAALSTYVRDTKDVIWISPADPAQENIFPITAFNGTDTVTFTNSGGNTLTPQTGVTWQIGRMPQVYDPAHDTVASLMGGSLPIPATNYDTGTVTVASGAVTLSGGSWSTILSAIGSPPPASAVLTLTIPNSSGIGTQQYLVKSFTNTSATLFDTTNDADVTSAPYTLSYTGLYFGVPPLGCSLCCNYRGRLVLAGGFWSNIWYMSRQDNPNDWDYGFDPNDPSRAVAGSNAGTGGPQEPLTAMMPHSDQYLIFATSRTLWKLTQDPAYGGQISALSRQIGCLAVEAWCSMPDSSIMLLSRDGLYLLDPGADQFPQSVSRPLLPGELVDVDAVNNYVSMVYDVQAQGIHLFVTPVNLAAGTVTVTGSTTPATAASDYTPTGSLYHGLPIYFSSSVSMYLTLGTSWFVETNWIISSDPPSSGGPTTSDWWLGPQSINGAIGTYRPGPGGPAVGNASVTVFPNGTHYFFDWVGKGFWPVALFGTMQPSSVIRYGPSGAASNVILGSYDGYLRQYSNAASDDDGTLLTSCIVYGPFRPGGPGYVGQLLQIAADIEATIENVQWVIGAGETSQEAVNEVIGIVTLGNAPRWSGLWSTGRNNRDFPRVSAPAVVIGIIAQSGLAEQGAWGIEGLRVEFKRQGPIR